MAIRRLVIEFNDTMGQVTLSVNDRECVQTTNMDYKAELGEIVQEYYDEVRK